MMSPVPAPMSTSVVPAPRPSSLSLVRSKVGSNPALRSYRWTYPESRCSGPANDSSLMNQDLESTLGDRTCDKPTSTRLTLVVDAVDVVVAVNEQAVWPRNVPTRRRGAARLLIRDGDSKPRFDRPGDVQPGAFPCSNS